MTSVELRSMRVFVSTLACVAAGGCGGADEMDDITPGGPTSLSPILDPTYEGRSLDGWASTLGSRDESDRYAALLALAEFRDEAVAHRAAIEARLGDTSASVRWAALETLGRMGEGAAASADAVVGRIADDDPGVRAAALRAVRRLGAPTVESLAKWLRGDDPTMSELAADAMVAIGAPSVDALASATADERSLTAVTAIVALGRLGTAVGAAGVEALAQATSRRGDVRSTALDALGGLGEAGLVVLRRLAASADADLARAATSRLPK